MSNPSIRQRQAATLSRVRYEVTTIQPDQAYSVTFPVAGRTMSITIILGDRFPDSPPELTVSEPVQHPAIQHGRVVSRHLAEWRPNRPLNETIEAIIQEFIQRPPSFRDQHSQQSYQYHGQPQQQQQPRQPPQQARPEPSSEEVDEAMGTITTLLESMTVDQLRKVAENDQTTISNVLEASGFSERLKQQEEELRRELKTFAQGTIEQYHDRLESAKSELSASYDELAEQQRIYEENKHRLAQLQDRYSEGQLRDMLGVAVAESEEVTEELSRKLTDGEIPVNDFVAQYLKARQDYHAKRIKLELLNKDLRS